MRDEDGGMFKTKNVALGFGVLSTLVMISASFVTQFPDSFILGGRLAGQGFLTSVIWVSFIILLSILALTISLFTIYCLCGLIGDLVEYLIVRAIK